MFYSTSKIALLLTLALGSTSCGYGGLLPRTDPAAEDFLHCNNPGASEPRTGTVGNTPLMLQVDQGKRTHFLLVPPGAATPGTVFTLQQISADPLVIRAEATPDQQLELPVTLSIGFQNCAPKSGKPDATLRIFRENTDPTVPGRWNNKGGTLSKGRRISTALERLSSYAVASAD